MRAPALMTKGAGRTAAALACLALPLAACGAGAPPTPVTTTVTETVQATPKSWPMPDEVGKDLQTAQDDLQALTGNPMFISTSKDLGGRSRHQINDRNWRVCTSTPAAGETFTERTNVVFGVVKNSETCP